MSDIDGIISGALFDFLGFLTTSETQWKFSARDDAAPAVKALEQWAEKRGLPLSEADVGGWYDAASQAVQPASPTEDDIINLVRDAGLDWHMGWSIVDGEPNHYEQLVKAAWRRGAAQREEDRRDAERYRWIEAAGDVHIYYSEGSAVTVASDVSTSHSKATLGEAIDAARAAGAQGGEA